MSATKQSFDLFRQAYPPKPLDPNRIENPDQIKQMTPGHGLITWTDGTVEVEQDEPGTQVPTIKEEILPDRMLWVVMPDDVLAALELCAFGRTLESKVIKHSNLTGGQAAHVAGELIMLDANTLVVNGRSGRYGPKDAIELEAVAKAFRRSGYAVWSMGWDDEANWPSPFLGSAPHWVSP